MDKGYGFFEKRFFTKKYFSIMGTRLFLVISSDGDPDPPDPWPFLEDP